MMAVCSNPLCLVQYLKQRIYADFIPILIARLPEVAFYATACLSNKSIAETPGRIV